MICEAVRAACLAPTPVSATVTREDAKSATCRSRLPSLAGLNSCKARQGANSFSSAKMARILTALPYAAAATPKDPRTADLHFPRPAQSQAASPNPALDDP